MSEYHTTERDRFKDDTERWNIGPGGGPCHAFVTSTPTTNLKAANNTEEKNRTNTHPIRERSPNLLYTFEVGDTATVKASG